MIDGSPYTIKEYNDALDYLTPEEKAHVERLQAKISLPSMPFRDFVQETWPIIEPNVPFLDNWHIGAISEHLEAVVWGQIKNLIINIPPRHMKSTLVSVMWQPWVWTFRPWSGWLFFSYSKDLSTRDNVQARQIMRSPFYKEAFGHVFDFAGDQNLKTRYKNDRGGHRIALSTTGSIGEGGDFLVGDDLLSAADRYSATKRENVNDFWSTTAATRRNTKDAAVVIIGQRLHQGDIVGHLDQKMQEGGEIYEKLVIPAEYEGSKYTTVIGWQDPRQKRGDLLWASRFPRQEIDRLKRDLGSEQTAAQLQQRPSPAGGQIFKVKWFKIWTPAGSNLPPVRLRLEDGTLHEIDTEEISSKIFERLQSWDMAFKGSKTSSFVAGQVWARAGANRYLIDQIRDRLDFPATLEAVKRLTAQHPKARLKLVEDKANGPAVIQTLKKQIAGLIPVSPKGDKVARAKAISPTVESGNVFLPHPQIAPWVLEFIQEAITFPNSPNNDQVDAMTQALDRFDGRKVAKAR